MIESIRKMWKIGELRKKILYTFFMLVLFRLVGVIPAPGVDAVKVMEAMKQNASTLPLLELVNMMTGNNFEQMTLMAMGITPYINASIIMQLLTIAIPALERLSKEKTAARRSTGSPGTVTIGLAALQAIGLVRSLGFIKAGWLNYVLVGVSMAGGTALAMWIGERITEKGIGNGISLLIFAGIISNIFNGIVKNFRTASTTGLTPPRINLVVVLATCILMTVVVTLLNWASAGFPCRSPSR
jgi:Preprotein translocase subunit SecY